jgi:NDP-sugar pyrophosphorylase family protein
MIPALVLTAGLATRLRPLSLVRAKAALPVAGDPLIRHILRWLAAGGVTDAVLNLHHLAHTITGIIGDGADGVRVRYSWEVPVLGSAGGPRRALPLLAASPFLIVNGDTLTNVDVGSLVADHRRSGALVTMAVVPNMEPDKYGGVVVASDGSVTRFAKRLTPASPFDKLRATPSIVEASTVRAAEQTYHFVGVQVVEADAFLSLPDNVPSESVAERYPALIAARRGSVRACVTSAEFFDIGTPGDYLSTSLLLGSRDPESRFAGARTRVASDARIENSVLWDDVEVEANARLRRCIVTDGVRVPAGSSWENATIRSANGALTDGERLVGDLAVGSL